MSNVTTHPIEFSGPAYFGSPPDQHPAMFAHHTLQQGHDPYWQWEIPENFDELDFKNYVRNKLVHDVRSASHTKRRAPWSEVVAPRLISEMEAIYLFRQPYAAITNDSNRMIKWKIFGNDDIVEWLGCAEQYVHPVTYDGTRRGRYFPGDQIAVYAFAEFEELEAKLEKKYDIMTIRVKTKVVETRDQVLPGWGSFAAMAQLPARYY